jgi:hypothetical protein
MMLTDQNHINESNLSDIYQRLMLINQEAFADGHYDVAYHALVAALHCEQTLKDIQGLVEVEWVAHEQLQWIDAHHPEYEHSTQSASARGHLSIYHNLARQARVWVQIIQNEAQWQEKE